MGTPINGNPRIAKMKTLEPFKWGEWGDEVCPKSRHLLRIHPSLHVVTGGGVVCHSNSGTIMSHPSF